MELAAEKFQTALDEYRKLIARLVLATRKGEELSPEDTARLEELSEWGEHVRRQAARAELKRRGVVED